MRVRAILNIIIILFVVEVLSVNEYKRVCYFTNWAQYRDGTAKYWARDVDPSLCTHIIYAFAKVQGNTILPYEWNDINEWAKGQYEMIRDVRSANPSLKILLAIGGWNHGSAPFTKMVATQNNINDFASNSLQFLRTNGFDGLDLDWEYPANRGSPPADKQRFTTLVKTLRVKFNNEQLTQGRSRLLLTAAVAAGKTTVESAYEISKISQHLDFINLMSYDLFSNYNTATQHNSPLYKSLEPNVAFNVDYAVKLWLNGGTPGQKLILGIAAYGRTYKLTNPSETGLGAPTSGQGTAGTHTKENGFMSYYEICSKIQKEGWTEKWLEDQKVPYAYHGNQWVGYDNIRSVEIKAKYIIDNGLGGGMFWAVDLDDFHGNCGNGKNPLMTTMKNVFNGAPPPAFVPIISPSGGIVIPPTSSGLTLSTTSITGRTQGPPSPGEGNSENKPNVEALQKDCDNSRGIALGILLTIAIATIIFLVIWVLILKGYDMIPKCLRNRNQSPEKRKSEQFTGISGLQPQSKRSNSCDSGGFNTLPIYNEQVSESQIRHKPPPVSPPPRFPPSYDRTVTDTPYSGNMNVNGSLPSTHTGNQYSGKIELYENQVDLPGQGPRNSHMTNQSSPPYFDITQQSKPNRLGTSTNV